MNLRRRAFLKQAALSLAAFGASQTGIAVAARRYSQALARPASRRLALLVGINQYPENVCDYDVSRSTALSGCLTDVQLQRLLLEYRFGFQPADIVTLTDQQATRQAIEDVFQTHLIEQATPGDLVFFHFSGLGSQVQLLGKQAVIRNSLVPVDGVLPTEDRPIINDLMEETLGLMLRSLPTEQVVTMLDLSYAKPQEWLKGSLKIRSRPGVPSGYVSEQEHEFQESLLKGLRGTREQSLQQWRSGQVPGLILKATKELQVAAEGQWSGFSAGLFTYALTQQLWWMTDAIPLNISISLAGGKVEQVAGSQQQPVFGGQKSTPQFLANHRFRPISSANADGVIVATDSNASTMQVSLVGLPAAVVENYGVNSLLQLVPVPDHLSSSETESLSSPRSAELAIAKDAPAAKANESSLESEATNASDDGLSQAGAVASEASEKTSTTDVSTGITSQSQASNAQSETVSDTKKSQPSALTGMGSAEAENASGVAEPKVILNVRSRDGLRFKAKIYNRTSSTLKPQVGQYVQEYVRLLSKNIDLVVALDAQLERIERVDATSALSSIPRISSVIAGEQPADFLFGRAQLETSIAMAPGA
ncbi:MAG: caspase family protein, partial [Elainellaceae cyanobacterium]